MAELIRPRVEALAKVRAERRLHGFEVDDDRRKPIRPVEVDGEMRYAIMPGKGFVNVRRPVKRISLEEAKERWP